MTINPYDWLARTPAVVLKIQRLPDGEMGGWIPGLDTIILDDRLTQVERRCTLMHELIHRSHGDTPDLPAHLSLRQEQVCSQRTSRLLITTADLLDALLWCHSEHEGEIADQLWVDIPTLRDRLQSLSSAERTFLTNYLRINVERAA